MMKVSATAAALALAAVALVVTHPGTSAAPSAGPAARHRHRSSSAAEWVQPPMEEPPAPRPGRRAVAPPPRCIRGTSMTGSASESTGSPFCSNSAAAGPAGGTSVESHVPKVRQMVSSYMSDVQRRQQVADTLETDVHLKYGAGQCRIQLCCAVSCPVPAWATSEQ